MQEKTVIIADGHHRYEVALTFHRETASKRTEASGWELYGYKLMSFVRLESEGVVIFPIHRLVHSLQDFNAAAFLERLVEFFSVQHYPVTSKDKFSMADKLLAQVKESQMAGQNAFVLYLPSLQKLVLLVLKKETSNRISWPGDKSPNWRQLDISVLQVVILGHLLGIGDRQLAEQTNLEYVSQHTEAIRTTDAKSYQCAFLLNPTPIEQVKDVVEAGDILPQKSTHFHPKLMEGLVFAKHV